MIGCAAQMLDSMVTIDLANDCLAVLTDRRNEFVSPIFSQPFDFECESVRTRNCWAVFLAIDRKAIPNQDFSGMTLAEGRLPGFGNVFRKRDSSFCALALAAACADFPLAVFNDPCCMSAFSGSPQLKSWWLDRTH